MQHHSRKPTVAILAAACLVGGVYVYAQRHAGAAGSGGTLMDLEATIAAKSGDVPVTTWLAYADELRGAGRYQNAASAYSTVLTRMPDNRPARIGYVVALAQAQRADELFTALNELTYGDPKLALELFDRPECRPFVNQERFAALQKESRVQVMD